MTRQRGPEPAPPQPSSPRSAQPQKFCPLAEKLPQILVGLAAFLVLAAIFFVFSRYPRASFPLLLMALLALLAAGLKHFAAWTGASTRPETNTNGVSAGTAPSVERRNLPRHTMVADPQRSYVDGEETCDNIALRFQPSEAPAKAQDSKQPPVVGCSVEAASGTAPLDSSAQMLKDFESPVVFESAAPVPALVGDGLVFNNVQLLAASRIGRRHINEDIPREDSYAVRRSSHGLLAVIADGVGSTRAAHTASDLVSRLMADWPWDPCGPTPWQDQVQMCVNNLQKKLLQDIGDSSNGASTMCFALLQPAEMPNRYRLWWAALGDSELMLVSDAGYCTVNKEPQAKHESTSAFPNDVAHVEAGCIGDLDMTQQQVLLATDGFAKPFHRDPAASMRDLNSALASGDPAYLLAAIRQTGSAFHDDATAVLLGGRRV